MKHTQARPLFQFSGSKTWAHRYMSEQIHRMVKEHKPTAYCDTDIRGLHSFIYMSPLLKRHNLRHVLLNDPYGDFGHIYHSVLHNKEGFIQCVHKLMDEFWQDVMWNPGQKVEGQSYYLKVRQEYNEYKQQAGDRGDRVSYSVPLGIGQAVSRYRSRTEQSARMMMLQMCAYLGVHRVNPAGNFTSPYDPPHLRRFSTTFDGSYEKFDKQYVEDRINKLHNLFKDFRIRFRTYSDIEKLKASEVWEDRKILYRLAPKVKRVVQDGKTYFDCGDRTDLIKAMRGKLFVYNDFHTPDLESVAVFPGTQSRIVHKEKVTSGCRDSNHPEIIITNEPRL